MVLRAFEVLGQNVLKLLRLGKLGLLRRVRGSPLSLFQHIGYENVLYPPHSVEVLVHHSGQRHHEHSGDVVVEFVVLRQFAYIVLLSVFWNELLHKGLRLVYRLEVVV